MSQFVQGRYAENNGNQMKSRNFLQYVKSEDDLRLPIIKNNQDRREISEFGDDAFSEMPSEIHEHEESQLIEKRIPVEQYRKLRPSTLDLYINDPYRHKPVVANNAFDVYKKKCRELMILPVPIGLKGNGIQSKDVIANDYRMGKDYIEAITEALKVLPFTETLSLRQNRIKGKQAEDLLIHNTDNIITLDLSGNPLIPFKTYQIIGDIVYDGYKLLKVLNLEGNKMGDEAMIIIGEQMYDNNCLKSLNVSDNLITCKSMPSASHMVIKATLTSLFLRWNTIAAEGCAILGEGLKEAETLKILDLSFNKLSQKFSKSNENTYPKGLSDMFEKNLTLVHLDLSHNEISIEDGEIIKVGLNKNQNILGLHMTGNYINTNTEGFLVKQKPHPASDSHIMTRLTDSLMMGQCVSPFKVEMRATSNGWIGEGWSEVKFMFDLTTADINTKPEDGELKGVNIHLDFDDYEPSVMKHSTKNPNLFTIVRMVPPKRKISYYFSIAVENMVPKTPPIEKLSKDVTKNGMIVFKKPKSKTKTSKKIKMK